MHTARRRSPTSRRRPPRPTSIRKHWTRRAPISVSSPPAPIPAGRTRCSGACQAERPRSASGVKLGRVLKKSPSRVRFSNRPSRVKHFQTTHHFSVDVAHGLSLLFGLGTKGPSIMGFEDEVEQSFGRPCRQCDCRFKRTYELTSSIVPRGHHSTVGWSSISSYCVGSCTDLKLPRLPWSTGIRCRQPTRGA